MDLGYICRITPPFQKKSWLLIIKKYDLICSTDEETGRGREAEGSHGWGSRESHEGEILTQNAAPGAGRPWHHSTEGPSGR